MRGGWGGTFGTFSPVFGSGGVRGGFFVGWGGVVGGAVGVGGGKAVGRHAEVGDELHQELIACRHNGAGGEGGG